MARASAALGRRAGAPPKGQPLKVGPRPGRGDEEVAPLNGRSRPVGPAGVPAKPPAKQNSPSWALTHSVGTGWPGGSGTHSGTGMGWSTAAGVAGVGMVARSCCNTLHSSWMAALMEAHTCLSSSQLSWASCCSSIISTTSCFQATLTLHLLQEKGLVTA